MTSARILVADEDPGARSTLIWLLRERGYDVTGIADGGRVIAAMEEARPDAVVLDVRHPTTNAYVVLESIRAHQRFRDVPVLIISALPAEEDVTRALGMGATDVLRKPVRVAELLARIDVQLRLHASARSAADALVRAEEQVQRLARGADDGAPMQGAGPPADGLRDLLEAARADNRRLEQLAQIDPLTDVLNRRALGDRLSAEMERVRRYDTTLSLLMIDLDHFKKVNDMHGHLVGDEVLMEVAARMQRAVRSVDIVARYGGEEFVIVLPETGMDGAERFAGRICEIVEAEPFTIGGGGPLQLTVSIGVAMFPSDGVESVGSLLAAADQALYLAKAEGRNRVRTTRDREVEAGSRTQERETPVAPGGSR